jgi:tRNA threonylcarbamoyladenosine biosynthesis protein TsaE
MQFRYHHHNIGSTAQAFIEALPHARVFAFTGAMGAGKTTFITAVCHALGVKDHPSSPTFSLINEYETAAGQTIYHIDLYRLKDAEEALAAGIEDALFSGAYCFVEWPGIAPQLFPHDTVKVSIELLSPAERLITVS